MNGEPRFVVLCHPSEHAAFAEAIAGRWADTRVLADRLGVVEPGTVYVYRTVADTGEFLALDLLAEGGSP